MVKVMAWFSDEQRPIPALVLDGLGWGMAVGCVLGFLGGIGGVVIGTPLGAATGLVAGFVAGVLLAGWQRTGASVMVVAVGTVGPVMALLALVPWWVWGVPPLHGLLFLGLPTVGPLTVDVVGRALRWPPRRAPRSGPRCVLSTRHCVLVIR